MTEPPSRQSDQQPSTPFPEALAELVNAMLATPGVEEPLADPARQAELSLQLRAALASRSVIDQAVGIIMAQQRCDAEQAFAILRVASQRQNRKLRTIAARMVETVSVRRPTQEARPADEVKGELPRH